MPIEPTIPADPRALYLDLLEKSIANSIHGESEMERRVAALRQRIRHPILSRRGALTWPPRAHSMLSPERLRNVRELAERALAEDIPGDYIETGVWRGGACILMRGVLAAHGDTTRRVYVADSFAGLPPPEPAYPADRRARLHHFSELAVSREEVAANFAAYGLLDDRVLFVEGLFKDTLPN